MTGPADSRALGVSAVLVAAMLWGTTGTAATLAPGVGPLAIGAAAMGIGGLLQAGLAWRGLWRQRVSLAARRTPLLLGSLAVAVYPLAFYSSMHLAGVAIGTVITIGSAPLFSALIEWQADGLALTRRWLTGALLGLVGMGLLCLTGHDPVPADASAGDVFSGVLPGVLVGLLAGLTYAFYSWAAHRVMQSGVSSSVTMGAVFGLGGLWLLPVLLVTGGPFLASWRNLGIGAYMAIVPMFLGYVCFGLGLARIRASLATTLSLLEPVVAAVLAVAVVGETLAPAGWAGVVLILASLVVVTLPGPRPRRAGDARLSRRRAVSAARD